VRNALVYVFGNARKHGVVVTELLDPCTSAGVFDGWKEFQSGPPGGPTWLAKATTWALRIGWRIQHGAISIRELPRGTPRA